MTINIPWKPVFDNFCREVTTFKKYKKINYDDYKKLYDISIYNKDTKCCINFGKTDVFLSVGKKFSKYYFRNDKSLGSFLYDNYYKEENQEMTTISGLSATSADKLATKAYICDNTVNSYSNSIDSLTDTYSYLSSKVDCCPTFDEVEKMINEKIMEKKKGNENMKGFNFDFGPCTPDQARMSMYGIAVKNTSGVYVAYNPKAKEIIDVDILNFDGSRFMYKMPVAIKDVAIGDVIIHNRKPMFVIEINEEGKTFTCVDPMAGEQKQIIPTTNMFGFNFITKIVSLFNTFGENAPSPDQPFGNMLPLVLMGDNGKIDPMMLMMMMGGKMDMSNPMMLYFMLKDNKDIDPIMLMAMSGMFNAK